MSNDQLLKQTHEMVSQLVGMVAELKNDMDDVKGRLTKVESRLTNVEDRLTQLEAESRGSRHKEREQDRVIDVLASRTTRLEAKLGS